MILRCILCAVCLAVAIAEEGARPYLGLIVEPVAGIDAGGAVVTKVVPGTTAERLGLRTGDVIVRIGDRAIARTDDIADATAAWKTGGSVALTVRRGTETLDLTGPVVEAPRPRELGQQAQALELQMAQVRDPAVVPGHRRLEELLTLLKEVERDLPTVAGEFRRHYPKGRFDISIHIDISSDTEAAQPQEIAPAARPPERSPPAP